jgi:hypothetical protein
VFVNEKPEHDGDTFYDVLGHFVQEVSADPQGFVRIVQHHMGSEKYPGLVISLTSCPNAMARELHVEISELVDEAFFRHGIKPRQPV